MKDRLLHLAVAFLAGMLAREYLEWPPEPGRVYPVQLAGWKDVSDIKLSGYVRSSSGDIVVAPDLAHLSR